MLLHWGISPWHWQIFSITYAIGLLWWLFEHLIISLRMRAIEILMCTLGFQTVSAKSWWIFSVNKNYLTSPKVYLNYLYKIIYANSKMRLPREFVVLFYIEKNHPLSPFIYSQISTASNIVTKISWCHKVALAHRWEIIGVGLGSSAFSEYQLSWHFHPVQCTFLSICIYILVC